MEILRIDNQVRRDMWGVLKCESCNHEQKFSGYDDKYYHDEVIPTKKCESCGESTKTMSLKVVKTPTKYPEGFEI
jgi:hypothetical protein